jgi:tRNA(Ile2) C34 agmatinyltransferase TiaS
MFPDSPVESWLIGIDDTDNLESRGTGFRARELGRRLQEQGLGTLAAITRHQLLVSPEIPYTSHNSSACLEIRAVPGRRDALIEYCAAFLAAESAEGSDAGLCVAPAAAVDGRVADWGRRAQTQVLTQAGARALAREKSLFLQGYTGTHGGIIGALAAVGLRASGNDGRFLWLKGIRDRRPGRYRLADLKTETGVQAFRSVDGTEIHHSDTLIEITEWFRPVLLDGRAVLLLEYNHGDPDCPWRSADKSHVKRH